MSQEKLKGTGTDGIPYIGFTVADGLDPNDPRVLGQNVDTPVLVGFNATIKIQREKVTKQVANIFATPGVKLLDDTLKIDNLVVYLDENEMFGEDGEESTLRDMRNVVVQKLLSLEIPIRIDEIDESISVVINDNFSEINQDHLQD